MVSVRQRARGQYSTHSMETHTHTQRHKTAHPELQLTPLIKLEEEMLRSDLSAVTLHSPLGSHSQRDSLTKSSVSCFQAFTLVVHGTSFKIVVNVCYKMHKYSFLEDLK